MAVVPMLGLMLWNHSDDRQKAAVAAQEEALRLARLAASDQGRLVESTRHLLIALAESPAIKETDPSACSHLLADLLRDMPPYQNLSVANSDGDVFCSAVPLPARVNVKDRPAFRGTIQTRGFTTGDYRINAITGQPSLTFGYPVLDDAGQVRAVIAAAMDLSWLDKFAASAQLPEGSTVTLTDSGGVVLARYPDSSAWRGKTVDSSSAWPFSYEIEGTYQATGVDGVMRFYGFARLQYLTSGEIFVLVGIPRDAALFEAGRTLQRNLIILGAVTTLSLALAGIGSQLLVLRPVSEILKAVQRLDNGDFGARVGQDFGGGPLGYLARSLDRAAENLQARDSEIHRVLDVLQLHTTHAETLAREAGRLASHLELPDVLRVVCEGATAILSVQAASICLRDGKDGMLKNVSDCGLPAEFQQKEPVPQCVYDCAEKKQTITVLRPAECRELADSGFCAALDICQIVTAPMQLNGRLIGALILYVSGEDRRFAEDDLNHLATFADQATLAISNARLYDSLRQEELIRTNLLREVISAQEDERKRIARELHDETSQELGALMVELESAAMAHSAAGSSENQHLKKAKSIVRRLMVETRRLVRDLRPALLDDLGLVAAIAWYGAERLEAMGIDVKIQSDPTEIRLPQAVGIALFRIAQEAMNNVAKHADASMVAISLQHHDHSAVLTIEDNGHGFDLGTQEASAPGRFGLQGIRERVNILGGEFSLRSKPDNGTLIEVRVPIPEEGDSHAQD